MQTSGAGQAPRQASRYMGLGLCAIRDAHRCTCAATPSLGLGCRVQAAWRRIHTAGASPPVMAGACTVWARRVLFLYFLTPARLQHDQTGPNSKLRPPACRVSTYPSMRAAGKFMWALPGMLGAQASVQGYVPDCPAAACAVHCHESCTPLRCRGVHRRAVSRCNHGLTLNSETPEHPALGFLLTDRTQY